MKEKIKFINIALTNRCNLFCKHCGIWQESHKKDIDLDLINRLFDSRALDKNVDLTLTGGEPFLHKNFTKIIELICNKKPHCLKTLSTNGTNIDKIIDFISRFKDYLEKYFSLHISLDGINKNDEQRPQFKTSSTIFNNLRVIRKRFPNINVKLKYTITPINYNDILTTYKYAKLNNLGFKIKLVENAKNYTNKLNKNKFFFNKEMKYSIIKSLLYIYERERILNKKEANFIRYTIQFLLGGSLKFNCKAPFRRVFVMPDGKVFSCIHFGHIGNLKKNDLKTIWESEKAERIRNKIKLYGCNRCVSYHGFC